MTSEQLLATRATLWRQKAEPLLTLDDAQSWLLQSGLCLFLPRKAQIPAPAPSFVEACLGETNATPPRTAIETAKGLLVRLIEANSALPLNLLGTASDHPDFLVSTEALPFVYALRGDRDWKHAPGTAGANRVSPLISQVWKLLEKRGVLTAIEIREELGRELTEAATLRALHELWASMRVIPLYQDGEQEALWEPLQSRHQKAMNSGVGMSQVTALSVLASVYLQSVVAASADDAETFLSPLASRSKVREVIRGLTATRQISMIQMETQSLLYVEGSLPEFPEAERVAESADSTPKPVRRPHPTSPEGLEAALLRKTTGATARPAYKRPSVTSTGERTSSRPATRGGGFRPVAGGRPGGPARVRGGSERSGSPRPAFKRSFSSARPAPIERSEPGPGLRADGSPKKPRWRDMPGGRPDQKGKPARFGPRKTEGAAGESSARPSAPRRESGSFRPAAGAKPGYQKSAYKGSSGPREGKPSRPSGAPFAGRPAASGGRPSSTGSRPPFREDRSGGSRPPARSGAGRFVARPAGDRPFSKPRRDDGPDRGRSPRSGAPAGDRKFAPRPPREGGFAPARPRPGGDKPYSPRSGGSSAPSRPYSARPAGGRPSASGRPPAGERSTGRPAAGGKPFGPSRTGGKPAGSGFKAGRPSSSGRPGGSRPGGSRSGPGAPRAGSKPTTGFKPAGRPGFGQGPRSTGRPPAKFKKRPERPE